MILIPQKKNEDVNSSTNTGKNNSNNASNDNNSNEVFNSDVNKDNNAGNVIDGEYVLNGYNPDIVEVETNKVDTPKKKTGSSGKQAENKVEFYPPDPPKW